MATPCFDVSGVTRFEYIGNGMAAKCVRPCVVWPFEQTGGVAVGCGRVFIPKRAGDESGDRVDDDQRAEFTTREDIIPNGNFIGDEMLANPFVYPFVTAAN